MAVVEDRVGARSSAGDDNRAVGAPKTSEQALLGVSGRVLERLERSTAAVRVVWGPPGSGVRRHLAALEIQEVDARSLPAAFLDRPDELAALALEAASDVLWIVTLRSGGDGALTEVNLAPLERALRPGQRLVVGARRRPTPGVGALGPSTLRLTPAEAESLWTLDGGSAAASRAALAFTAGWLEPLRLLALEEAEPAIWPQQPPLELKAFFEQRVLAALEPEEQRELRLLASGGPLLELCRDRGLTLGREATELVPFVASLIDGDGQRTSSARATRSTDSSSAGSAGQTPAAGQPSAVEVAWTTESSPRQDRPVHAASHVPRVDLALFGEPQVATVSGGGEVRLVELPTKACVQILAQLALAETRSVHRDDLAGTVWPHAPAELARKSLHASISHLRRGLAPLGVGRKSIRLRRGNYALADEVAWRVDVLEFERLVDDALDVGLSVEARVDSGEAAWKTYRGPFFEAARLAWIAERREGLHERYLRLLGVLGEGYRALDRPFDAEDALRTMLIHDPARESAHLELMRIYAERKRRDLVRRQYAKLCSTLLDELGLEPLDDTREEYHRMML